MNVHICDDHPVVRLGLKKILSGADDVDTVRLAPDGPELLTLVREHPPHVVVLDLGLPRLGGLEVLLQLQRERPALPVLILSVQPAEQYAVRVLRAGAAGYLMKEAAPEELIQAVRTVHAGHKYVTAVVAERLAEQLAHPVPDATDETLSNREFEVLKLLGDGCTVKQIASTLGLSDKTISTYRLRIMTKLALKNGAEIIRYCFQRGLAT